MAYVLPMIASLLPDGTALVSVSDAGVHNFNVTLVTVGTRSVTATDKVTSTITGTQSGIVVTH